MHIWILKESLQSEYPMVSFEPPDESDLETWLLLTTRDTHYKDIAKELDKQAVQYEKQNDYRAARVAKDLATELRRQTNASAIIN